MNKKIIILSVRGGEIKNTQYKALCGPVWGSGGRYAAQPSFVGFCDGLNVHFRHFNTLDGGTY